MKKDILKTFVIFAIIAVFFTLNHVNAQYNVTMPTVPATSGEDFIVQFAPEHPGPNTQVSAQAISYTFDINRATVAWLVNGKIQATGNTFSFTTGGLGTETDLDVSIITAEEHTLSKSFTFRAGAVDLLWETPTYTPPQYRGKALVSPQASIKVTAIPQGLGVSDSKLVYEWQRNDKNLPDASGQGKKTLTFYSDESGQEVIDVKVSTLDKSATAESQVIIYIIQPEILFYEENPLEGPRYQNELGSNFTLSKEELILRAEPFFFSERGLPGLSYVWQMNDKTIDTPQKPNVLKLAVSSGTKGVSNVKLTLNNQANILEAASRSLQVNFNFE